MLGLAATVAVWCLQIPIVDARTAPTRLVTALFVNHQAKGDVFAVRSDDDIWLSVTGLAEAGLVGFSGERRDWFGEPHVSLRSLAPDLTFEFDMIALALRLTASPALFARTTITLQAARPPQLEYLRSAGLFVNYGLTLQDQAKPGLAVEAGLSLAGALLSSSFTRTGDHHLLRGLTSLTIDQRSRTRRIIVGDTFAPRSLLGSSPLVGGISIRRQFSLDPYEVRFPLPSIQGAVTSPATAEVYINDQLVGRESLPPGAFQLLRVPARTGLGDVRVVVRDLLGREQRFGGPYYLTSNVLRPGISDYHYLVGLARTDALDRRPIYRSVTWSAAHRRGVNPWLTLGAHTEGSRAVATVGPTMTVRLWRLGEGGASAAVSRSQRQTGAAVSGSYSMITTRVSVTVSASHVGPRYSSLSLSLNDPRQLNRFDASVGSTLGRSTSLLFARSYLAGIRDNAPDPRALERYVQAQEAIPLLPVTTFESQARLRDSVTLTVRLASRARLAASMTRTARGDQVRPTLQGYVSVSVVMTPRTVATVTSARTGEIGSTSVDLQRSLPLGPGIGYRFFGTTGAAASWNAQAHAQGRIGRISLRQDFLNGRRSSSVEVTGGLVFTGGELNLSRRIDDGYALVRVPAGPGIRVYLNDQIAGRTNDRGSVLVPNLLSQLGNPIRIADEDVPLEYDLTRLQALVAPPWRGGGVVTFPAVRMRAVIGRVILQRRSEEIVPAFGRLVAVADSVDRGSPVGADGEFFLEDVPPGEHPVQVAFEGDTYVCTILVPVTAAPITDVGVIRCASAEDARP